MRWLIGFFLLIAVVFLAGVAKGGVSEGGSQVISFIKGLLGIAFKGLLGIAFLIVLGVVLISIFE